jgi:hypothetical protein
MELAGAAVAWATRRRGSVTRSSFPRMLAGTSVVEARLLGRGDRGERAAQSRRRGEEEAR